MYKKSTPSYPSFALQNAYQNASKNACLECKGYHMNSSQVYSSTCFS